MQWRKWRKIASLWRFELDAKAGPLEAGDFGENYQRVGDIQNVAKYSNWMLKVAPLNLITKEVLITARQQYEKKVQITCLIRGPNNCEATFIKFN